MIWILAGGASRRMGSDKARVTIGGTTFLERVREVGLTTGHPVRVIRKDAVPKCGPLGGIVTGLRRSKADWHLFLACDMPAITGELLARVMAAAWRDGRSVAVVAETGFGFPLALSRAELPLIEQAIESGKPSLQRLARVLGLRGLPLPSRLAGTLRNINTPGDLAAYREAAG